MTTSIINFGADITGNTVNASAFVGSGSGVTGINRTTGLTSDTPNTVVINNVAGVLSSEAQLATSRGGTGLNTSALTGVGKVTAGTWSVASIVDTDVNAIAAIARTKLANGTNNQVVINSGTGVLSSEAQLSNSRGGTGLDTSAMSGVGKVTAGTWSVAPILDADIFPNAAIARTKLATGIFDQVLINSGTGTLSSEAYLANSRGGTGISSVGLTGIGKVTAGVWSIASILDADVNATAAIARTKLANGTINQVVINSGTGVLSSEAQLSNSRGGTGLDTSAMSGVGKVTAGTWSVAPILDADIFPNAAIARTKLATGIFDQVLINSGTGTLSSEAYLANSRGGTGISSVGLTGIGKVTAGVWSIASILDADVNATAAIARTKLANGTANTIVVNDSSGVLSSSTFIDVSTNDIKINPTGDIILQKNIYYDIDKLIFSHTANVKTTSATVTTIYSIALAANTAYTFTYQAVALNTTDSTSGSFTGMVKVQQKTSLEFPIIGTILSKTASVDTGMSSLNITTLGTTTSIFALQVTGIASKIISWKINIDAIGVQ